MARTRRKPAKPQKTPEQAGATDDDAQVHEIGEEVEEAEEAQEERCPACPEAVAGAQVEDANKEKWVRCDACKTWFHWRCAGDGDLDAVDMWFCKPRVITMKPPARKSTRKKQQRDYAGLNAGQEADPSRWLRMMEGKPIKKDPFKRMPGADVGLEWLQNDEEAMKDPIVVETEEGLGMKMPRRASPSTTSRRHVATQSNVHWTLGKWQEYWNTEADKRDKIRNVISLEVSGTDLADRILPPRIVRELDWVEKFWPSTKKGRGHTYPKVQLYCLMGVAGAWTDWHIDFAGSSVYYHILHGKKVFYFIRPTPANLAAYERWSGSEAQNHSWLGDMCDEVFKVELTTGNTMIIPTGWIHAVYTPIDTLVFGGNFLHSYNVPMQLRVREIEIATHVPKKFRFPQFSRLCWYAAEKYIRDLKAKEEFPPPVLEGIEAIAEFLVQETRTMERGTDAAKRQAKEEVPGDRIKDPHAVARELRWRARHAAGYASDDDSRGHRRTKTAVNGDTSANGASHKRKRTGVDASEDGSELFRNFKRPGWEKVEEQKPEKESALARAPRPKPGTSQWTDAWASWEAVADGPDGEDAQVERQREVIVKVRRTARGLERQRVERVLEEWTWTSASASGTSTPRTVLKTEGEDVELGDAAPEPPAVAETGSTNGTAEADGGGTSAMAVDGGC
ncbi:Clavaminate synthase-like protein [Epithele typhae]|uniref:Clavaminate synthase-like protein n=1 Tax=Epithele typhae TaxID=378194 RepID=UPI0020077502|nr:Clavaminate synthase-like protein [Epithele typhae]KAH9946403.1 Clavaminate synthase-like protein [Epithele typhae]